MFFYLDYRFSSNAESVGIQLSDTVEPVPVATNTLYVQQGFQRLESIDTPGGRLFLLGDPIFRNRDGLGLRISPASGNIDEAALYESIPGHYYWFLLHRDGLCCGTSFGAIFPVYYHLGTDRVVLSSSSVFLAGHIDAVRQDRRNLLERLLFNYPFFNSTWWSDIRLLDAHRHLRINGSGAATGGQFEISRYFGTGEKHSRESLMELTGLFGEECKLFLPDAPFGISFTGGFDGRTLVAAALKAGQTGFLTYSFGRPGASDVTVPAEQTKQLGIPYLPILLDQDYLIHHAMESALAFLRLTGYNGNFGRPHYHYAALKLSEKVGYLLTGNFGSEMFRALHQPGVMMTENLIQVFARNDASWKDVLKQSTDTWGGPFFRQELDELIADLDAYRSALPAREPNHQFYHFVFNEIFRKYFGPELVMQSHYLNNRTPFLSLRFFHALNDTIWSGVHSKLFEKQKNKRLKGQIFYSAFLRGADSRLYRQPTSKGYSPADVLETWRRPLLLGKVGLHKYLRKQETDSNSENAFLERYRTLILEQIKEPDDGFLHRSGITGRLLDAIAKENFDEIIQLCSIAAGWNAAKAGVVT